MRNTSDGIWKVNLILTDDSDQQLKDLTHHMRNGTSGATGWHRLGSLMTAMGQFDKAEEFYVSAFEMTPDNDLKELTHLHHKLGRIHDEKGDLEAALFHYKETLSIQLGDVPRDDPSLSLTYHTTGIGSVLMTQYDFDKASDHFQHSLSITLQNPNPDLLKIATIHSYMSEIFYEFKEFKNSLTSHQEALNARQKHLPPVHPLLVTTYNSIGLVHETTNGHLKALYFYEKTLNIEEKSLSSNHPTLVVVYHNMSEVLERLNRYQEAVKYQMHAVNIVRMAYEPDHQQLKQEENDFKKLQEKL
ncbi:unnamed protein product [Rotaria socialis]|uniref:Kinesin light chain n=1 Tax=Rotaria socialis TaxID=392032 RepID=A0A820TSK6_9BILA|nr:unnamed protein product [Rotaria socialis]CAF4470833.1 unnamed protein product [Rotaria socialis]